MNKTADLVIIGGGPSGYEAAFEAADKGMEVILIEKENVGGTCLNHGCIPTKAIMHSTKLYKKLGEAKSLNMISDIGKPDLGAFQIRKNETVESLRSGLESQLKKKKIEVIKGIGELVSSNLVKVNDETIECRYTLLATGTRPHIPSIKGADSEGVYTSDELLELNELNMKSLTIIGGGVIGMEFATIFNDMGVKVIVIEALERILANMDKEISQSLKMIMKKRGVDIFTSSLVKEIEKTSEGLICTYDEKGQERETTSDAILIATGRKANVEILENERGFISIDDSYKTRYENVYAVGDVNGGIQLAHVAAVEGRNAVRQMLGIKELLDVSAVPSCIYTEPEIASVGVTQAEAKEKGLDINVKKYPMLANAKTVIEGLDRGFIKIIEEGNTHKVIGGQMMCGRATDLISELTLAITKGLRTEDIGLTMHPHPTFSEGIKEATQ